MAISNATKTKINRMNRVAKDADLGSRLQVAGIVAGSAVVSLAQQSASAVIVYDAFATQQGQIFNITTTDGSPLALTDYKFARSGGSLTIMPVNSGSFTVGDKITYILI